MFFAIFNVFKWILITAFLLILIINIFMHFKPLKAFILFLIDWWKLDKKVFRGYGFWLFCGLGGSGKTLSMVEYMARMKQKYPKLKIYTNFNFKLADGFINSWQDIVDLDNGSDGMLFGFDEIHLTFQSDKWKDCPENMLEYISQQRKLRKQIVASSQVFTRVDKKLREQTNYVVECSSLFMGRWIFNKSFHTADYLANDEKADSGARKRRRAWRRNFVACDSIRNLYDTFQVMIDLKKGKSEEKQKLESIVKILDS